ncbi:MAG: SH3 domain-containing protein [Proteobacteria bacterium]|nr:SH3 domain-containing protein [Pseudomonadota bacterium]
MIEEYITYWGLKQHPFLLAPDSKMMCVTGQYYECLERLKYAINTNKGGVLVVSEDAGLGKTTILLKLIDEMREEYGDAFRYAFIDHPTLTSSQMIAHITQCITDSPPDDDKLKNLMVLKNTLTEVKERGGKNIIIVDEGQMLCEAKDVLQELRTLINLMHNNEYLHTFILSGQRALWNTIKGMPEFWQRLPVRYYFIPLRVEETKELVKYRLKKAGLDEGREIFANDALEIIHRYSMGSPRTIIALSDLSLLVGFTNHAKKISFKEVSKAINAMSGKGEGLPYVTEERHKEREPSLKSFANVERSSDVIKGKRHVERNVDSIKGSSEKQKTQMQSYLRPVYAVLAIVFVIVAGTIGYYYTFQGMKDSGIVVVKKEIEKQPQESKVEKNIGIEKVEKADTTLSKDSEPVVAKKEDVKQPQEEEVQKDTDIKKADLPTKEAIVSKIAANIRISPDIRSPRIAMLFRGETVKILSHKTDRDGMKWYKIHLYGNREGWIADSVVTVRQQ